MKKEIYDDELDQYKFRSYTGVIKTVLMAGAIVVQSFVILSLYNSQRTVILPPVISKPFSVDGDSLDKGYLYDLATFLAHTSVTLTPKNAKEQLSNLLPWVHQVYFEQFKESLLKQARYLEANNISQVFYPASTNVDVPGVIEISGVRKRYVADKLLNTEKIVLKVLYQVDNGRFQITNMEMPNAK